MYSSIGKYVMYVLRETDAENVLYIYIYSLLLTNYRFTTNQIMMVRSTPIKSHVTKNIYVDTKFIHLYHNTANDIS